MATYFLANDAGSLPLPGGGVSFLKIDPRQYAENFNERHFVVAHNLRSHPLFEIPRLLDLAKEVAAKWHEDLYYARGVTHIGQRWSTNPSDFPVDEALRNIKSCGAWDRPEVRGAKS